MLKSSSSPPSYPKFALAYRHLAALGPQLVLLAVLIAIGGVR
jgi:hypothetical protein